MNAKTYKKARKKTLALFFLFALFFPVSGCKSTQREDLEHLISMLNISTGREVSRHIQDAKDGLTGPVYAEVLIKYEVLDNHTKEELYMEIISTLKKNGWQEQGCDGCNPEVFYASFLQSDYPLPVSVIVHLYLDEDLVSLRMTHPKP